jgi:archaellum component FlaC
MLKHERANSEQLKMYIAELEEEMEMLGTQLEVSTSQLQQMNELLRDIGIHE